VVEESLMSCVLRLRRDAALLEDVLASVMQATPARAGKSSDSVNVAVSEADFTGLDTQIRDAIEFLRRNKAGLAGLRDAEACLDFGVERRDVAVQTVRFPAELLRLAGTLGISIEVSLYPEMEGAT
jgi:hypothetical protein